MLEIITAQSPKELDEVRQLIRAFVTWHRATHTEDLALIERYFDANAFEAELAGLPGKYSPPGGALLLAYHDGQPAGCVAMRNFGEGVCEMKRMFVPAAMRGLGVGRALAEAVIEAGRQAGYQQMRLDTSRSQVAATTLYERQGFVRVAPYYSLTDDLKDWLVFYEKALAGPVDPMRL